MTYYYTQARPPGPNWRYSIGGDPACAAIQLAEVQRSRPLKPPPYRFVERQVSAAARDAARAARGYSGLGFARGEADTELEADTLSVVEAT